MTENFKYRPVLFFSLTFVATFALIAVGAFLSYSDELSGLTLPFIIAGMCAPFVISLVMIVRSGNAQVKREFVNRLINLKLINLKVLPIMILMMPLVVLVSITISLPFGESVAQFGFADGFSFSAGAMPVLVILLLAATFEELGWRGYAFDSLQSRYTFLKASLVFGVLWSLWHFPLVFVKDSYQYEILQQSVWYAVNFFVSIIPLGIIVSWICVKNNKSVLAAIVFHFIINMCQEALGMTQNTKCIETAVLMVVALAIVAYDKEMFFHKAYRPSLSGFVSQAK